MEKKKKTALIITGIVLLVLGAIYLGGLLYFKDHFLPRTTINGMNVSGMSVENANEAIRIKEPSISVVMRKDKEGQEILRM